MMKAALPALLLAGCAAAAPPPQQVEGDPALMAALYLDALSIAPTHKPDFLCVGNEDAGWEGEPPPSVIALLRSRTGLPIVPSSNCRRDESSSAVVAGGVSGKANWLTIGDIGCATADRCTATVSYHVTDSLSGGREVTALRAGKDWRVQVTGRSWSN